MAVGAGSAPSPAASSPGRLVAPSPGEIGRRRSRVRSRRRYSVLLHARVHVPKMPGVRKNTRNRITGSTRQHRIQKAKAHLGLAFKLGVFLECADVDFRLCQALLQSVDLGARFEATSAVASRVVALVADTVSEARLDEGATPPLLGRCRVF